METSTWTSKTTNAIDLDFCNYEEIDLDIEDYRAIDLDS